MKKIEPVGEQFEDLVSRILTANGFEIEAAQGHKGVDFLAKSSCGNWAIEVKYYRTARAQPILLNAAAARLATSGLNLKPKKGMLIISCYLAEDLCAALSRRYNIELFDRKALRGMCAAFPSLAEELDAILESDPDELQGTYSACTGSTSSSNQVKVELSPALDTKGTELRDELKGIKAGEPWRDYEEICERVLKYLFGGDLYGWYSQKSTTDGLSRYDSICRVRPGTEFWKFIIEHLNSRYVLFEYKNYTEKIKQGEVLTTEKYLLERALRRVAIIMTRGGADANAIVMAQGAMREHGKLILILDDEEVFKMLLMKERGEDPSDYLFEVTDNFLMTLPR